MKRWLLLMLISSLLVVPALSLFGLNLSRDSIEEREELLTYAIMSPNSVKMHVPTDALGLSLLTWPVVEQDSDVNEPIPYQVRVTWLDSDDHEVHRQDFHLETTIALDVDSKMPATRLVGTNLPVGEARRLVLASKIGTKPIQSIRVSAEGTRASQILLRAMVQSQRTTLEHRLLARTLGARERESIVRGRLALGWADLSDDAQMRALQTWERPMDAVGREGADYSTQRILLSDIKKLRLVTSDKQTGTRITPNTALAIQLRSPTVLHLRTRPGTKLSIQEGHGSPWMDSTTDSSGLAIHHASRNEPRTVLIRTQHDECWVHALVPTENVSSLIAHEPITQPDGILTEIQPLERVMWMASLSETSPIVARIAPEQDLLGVTVRAKASVDLPPELFLRARWKGLSGIESTETPILFQPSILDSWATGEPATEEESFKLQVPKGVSEVQLFGSPFLYASIFTTDDSITTDLLDPSYDAPISQQQRWQHAPYVQRQRSSYLPSNRFALESSQRVNKLSLSPRIVTVEPSEVSEVELQPRGSVPTSAYLEPIGPGGREIDPRAHAKLGRSDVVIRVPDQGKDAGQVRIRFWGSIETLGSDARVVVDDQVVLTQSMVMRGANMVLDVAPGNRRIRVEASGEFEAYANCPPANGAGAFRVRSLARLNQGRSIDWSFHQPSGQRATVVVFVTTERSESWSLSWSAGGNDGPPKPGVFFRSVTVPAGVASGVGTGQTGGTLWAAESPSGSASVQSFRVSYGDDLAPGQRSLRINLKGGTAQRVWVRAVLVSQSACAQKSPSSLWIEDAS